METVIESIALLIFAIAISLAVLIWAVWMVTDGRLGEILAKRMSEHDEDQEGKRKQ